MAAAHPGFAGGTRRSSQGVQARWLQWEHPQWLLLLGLVVAQDFSCNTQRMLVTPLLGDFRDPSCMMPSSHAVLIGAGRSSDTGKDRERGERVLVGCRGCAAHFKP